MFSLYFSSSFFEFLNSSFKKIKENVTEKNEKITARLYFNINSFSYFPIIFTIIV